MFKMFYRYEGEQNAFLFVFLEERQVIRVNYLCFFVKISSTFTCIHTYMHSRTYKSKSDTLYFVFNINLYKYLNENLSILDYD